MKIKSALGVAAALVVLLLASVGFTGSAFAGTGWDGCPAGEFVLEYGCVLCLPGYSHQKTGSTSDHGYDCYTCAPNKAAGAVSPKKMCRVQAQQVAFSATQRFTPEERTTSSTSSKSSAARQK